MNQKVLCELQGTTGCPTLGVYKQKHTAAFLIRLAIAIGKNMCLKEGKQDYRDRSHWLCIMPLFLIGDFMPSLL